jgi:hypothetical protein
LASGRFDTRPSIGFRTSRVNVKKGALRDHKLVARSRLVVRKWCARVSRWRLETLTSAIEALPEDVEAGRPVERGEPDG